MCACLSLLTVTPTMTQLGTSEGHLHLFEKLCGQSRHREAVTLTQDPTHRSNPGPCDLNTHVFPTNLIGYYSWKCKAPPGISSVQLLNSKYNSYTCLKAHMHMGQRILVFKLTRNHGFKCHPKHPPWRSLLPALLPSNRLRECHGLYDSHLSL